MSPESPLIGAFAHDPYRGWSPGTSYLNAIKPAGIDDIRAARNWFGNVDLARSLGLYTHAFPLDGVSGAESRFLDQPFVSFSTYGYLGLNGHPAVQAAAEEALRRYGTTTGGVRLLTGTAAVHLEAEERFADWLGRDACALFSSGYDANLAAISSLFGPRDTVLMDERAHRSLVDACALARTKLVRFRHNDMNHLEELALAAKASGRRTLIVVDGVYSMDGDVAPLPEIVDIKRRTNAFLLVDDSHALGVIGSLGRGSAHEHGVNPEEVDILTSSLGKAFPSTGGIVAGSHSMITFLRHGATPFMFSSALSPANAAAAAAAIGVIEREPQRLERLRDNSRTLRELLAALKLGGELSTTAVVPLILGDIGRAYVWARTIIRHGVYVSPVPSPAVAAGLERLRLCATADHRQEHFELLETALRACLEFEAEPGGLERMMQEFTESRG